MTERTPCANSEECQGGMTCGNFLAEGGAVYKKLCVLPDKCGKTEADDQVIYDIYCKADYGDACAKTEDCEEGMRCGAYLWAGMNRR